MGWRLKFKQLASLGMSQFASKKKIFFFVFLFCFVFVKMECDLNMQRDYKE